MVSGPFWSWRTPEVCFCFLVPFQELIFYAMHRESVDLDVCLILRAPHVIFVLCPCSSVMAIVTCLVGLHYGHIIVHFKVTYSTLSKILYFLITSVSSVQLIFFPCHFQEHKDRTLHWMVPSTCFLVLGLVLDLLGKKFICSYILNFIEVELLLVLTHDFTFLSPRNAR